MSEAVEMPSISDLREEGVDEITQPYRKQINETPELLSLLYDINLLPEQIVYRVNAVRMAAFCLVYQKIAEARQEGIEQAAKLCEDHGHSNGKIRASHKHLAAAIRTLKDGNDRC